MYLPHTKRMSPQVTNSPSDVPKASQYHFQHSTNNAFHISVCFTPICSILVVLWGKSSQCFSSKTNPVLCMFYSLYCKLFFTSASNTFSLMHHRESLCGATFQVSGNIAQYTATWHHKYRLWCCDFILMKQFENENHNLTLWNLTRTTQIRFSPQRSSQVKPRVFSHHKLRQTTISMAILTWVSFLRLNLNPQVIVV